MFILTDFKSPEISVSLNLMKYLSYKILEVYNFYSKSTKMIVYPTVEGYTREFPSLCMSSDDG